MARDDAILIRLTDKEKQSFKEAAKLAGIGVSAWARQRLRLAAIKEMEALGRQIPFLDDTTGDDDDSQ